MGGYLPAGHGRCRRRGVGVLLCHLGREALPEIRGGNVVCLPAGVRAQSLPASPGEAGRAAPCRGTGGRGGRVRGVQRGARPVGVEGEGGNGTPARAHEGRGAGRFRGGVEVPGGGGTL